MNYNYEQLKYLYFGPFKAGKLTNQKNMVNMETALLLCA